MRSPTFCLIGAPRTGTTSMFRVLAAHPRIFVSPLKEPDYFCDDLSGLSKVPDARAYGRLYRGVEPDHLASGEASVWYLYSKSAPVRLHAYSPDARILVNVRNPLQVVESLHAIFLFYGWEDEPDLASAIRLEGPRLGGKRLPRFCPNPLVLQYTRIAKFGEQLIRWQTIFPRQRFFVTVFDDFVQDTSLVYRRTLDFLGVAHDGRTSFPRDNARRTHRSRVLGRLLRTPPPAVQVAGRALRRALKSLGVNDHRLIQKLTNFNSRPVERTGMDSALRADLCETFAADVSLLSETLGRDLTHWVQPQCRTDPPDPPGSDQSLSRTAGGGRSPPLGTRQGDSS